MKNNNHYDNEELILNLTMLSLCLIFACVIVFAG